MDPALIHCKFCYVEMIGEELHSKMVKCGQCHRNYCSEACRAKEWDFHKSFCSLGGGEVDVDIVIETMQENDKGVGVIAKRPFARGQLVMHERVGLSRATSNNEPAAIQFESGIDQLNPLVTGLMPHNGSVEEKFAINCVCTEEDEEGEGVDDHHEESKLCLFLLFARINHDCIGNVQHHFDADLQVLVVVASRDIAVGDELSYTYLPGVYPASTRRRLLRDKYGFVCRCPLVCSGTPDAQVFSSVLDRSYELEKLIFDALVAAFSSSASAGAHVDRACDLCEQLIAILSVLRASPTDFARAYYDSFQCAVLRSKTLPRARAYIRQAVLCASQCAANDKQIAQFRLLEQDVTKFRHYLICESHVNK